MNAGISHTSFFVLASLIEVSRKRVLYYQDAWRNALGNQRPYTAIKETAVSSPRSAKEVFRVYNSISIA